jgi:hypothetical protein
MRMKLMLVLNSASINILHENYTLVEPNFELTNFVLYPNPNKISLFSLLVRQNLELVVHDVLGRKIFERR